MPQTDGIEVLRFARQSSPETSVILITAVEDYEAAVQAVKGAAFNGLHRGFIVFYSSDQDDRGFRRRLPGKAQHLNAIGLRHLDISDQNFIIGGAELFLRGFTAIDRLNLVSIFAQGDVEHLTDGALVIADKNASHARPPRSSLWARFQARFLRPWRAGFPG